MKKKIKDGLISLKGTLDRNISPNKQKIIGVATTVPIIAASTMSGVCAGGCPYGLVNDPFPGQCSRYIDVNGDGICDLSQAVAATSTTSTGSSTSSSGDSTSSSSSSSGDSASASNSSGIDAQNGSSDHSNVSTTTVQDPGSSVGGNSPTAGNDFHIIPVSILIVGAYFFTHYLFSKGILKPKKHKRLWNLLMLGSYLGSGITGLLLIYMINWGVLLAYRHGLAYWHAELALLMTIITLIHFHLYRKSFKKMFKVLFKFRSGTTKTKTDKTPGLSK